MSDAEQSGGLQLKVDGHQAMLGWDGPAAEDFVFTLHDFLAEQSDILAEAGVSRVIALVAPDDSYGMFALHRNGFLREGLHIGSVIDKRGAHDVYSYAKQLTAETPHFSAVMNSVLPTHRVIAHVLIRDEQGRVLLEKVRYKSDWELPGGIVEANEPPRVGAEREVFEELGLELSIGKPLVVDWMPPYLGWADAIEFIFDGGLLAAETIADFQLAAEEIEAVHWVAVDEISSHVTQLSARRIASILASDAFYYSEDGRPVAQPDDAD